MTTFSESSKITFQHLSHACNHVIIDGKFAGWIDGRLNGKSNPLNSKKSTIQFRSVKNPHGVEESCAATAIINQYNTQWRLKRFMPAK